MKTLRFIFRLLNKGFMVPMFRMRLGRFVGNPITGYIMVLKTIGHKSGLVRYAPVNYAILDGNIYCLSGLGKIAHWYKNLTANPNIELILPAATISGKATTLVDSDETLSIMRQILKNSGFASFMAGINAFAISDEDLREKGSEMIIIRITPNGIFSGAADPGGRLWFWLTIVTIIAIALLLIF